MMTKQYHWEGILQSGEKIHGLLEASDPMQVNAALRKRGILARKIVRKRAFSPKVLYQYTHPIKALEMALFTRQLATLLNAGIALSEALEILESGVNNAHLKAVIKTVRLDVNAGLMLTQALRKHPALFNSLYCNMIHAGEQSGSLESLLINIADYQDRIARIKHKMNKALAYPAAVTFIAILVTAGLLTFVVPQFESLFKQFNAELPVLTRIVMKCSTLLKAGWPMMMLITIIMTSTCVYAHKRSNALSTMVSTMNQRLILTFPIIGNIVQKASIARFTRTLSITLAAGLPLTEALTSVSGVSGIGLFAQAAHTTREAIAQGLRMSIAMQHTALFPEMVIQLITIGEESGTLDHMLNNIADFYDEDVSTAIDTLSDLLEPLVMTTLGLFIGGLVIALYLPILTLGSII